MSELKITELIDQVSKSTGLAPSTICGRACGDPLLYERLLRRDEQDKARRAKIKLYCQALLESRKSQEAAE